MKYISLFLEKKLVRFFLVSGLNTLFGYGLFALLLYLGLTYSFALLFSTVAGIIFNFKTLSILVFENKNNILILKFIGVYVIAYLCNLGFLSVSDYFNLDLYLCGAVLIVPVGLLAYLLNKTFVFK